MKRWMLRFAAVALTLGWTAEGFAYQRDYIDTFQAFTLRQTQYDIEIFTDLRHTDHLGNEFFNSSKVGYGITDNYSIGFYGEFTEGLGFTAFKFENRLRLNLRKPVAESALYFLIKDANNHKDTDELEFRYLLSKNDGIWDVSANFIMNYERQIGRRDSDTWKTRPGLALAAAFQQPDISPGVELFLKKDESRITPGLYINITPEVRLNLGLSVGLVDEMDDWQIRTLLRIIP